MKKLALIFTAIVIFIVLLVGYSNFQYKQQNIYKITNVKNNEITKIVFTDGRGWNKPFSLEDNKKISEFVRLMDKYVLKKEEKYEPATGWTHNAIFYISGKKSMSITFTDPLIINGVYYDIVKGWLNPKDIDDFIKLSNPNWVTKEQ